jgi:hypothetical protein
VQTPLAVAGVTGSHAGGNAAAAAMAGNPQANGTQTYGSGGMSGQQAVNQGFMNNLGSDPSHVSISPDILNSMSQYQNAAYDNQTSRLDPQWQQKQNQFDQQMVAQGLQPGSQAYNNAYQQFQQGQNDAYSQAYNNSFQTGLAAQGQSFNQGYQNSQLANALAIANMQKSATLGAAGIGANASMHNADAANATNQMLGLGNLGLGYGNLQNQNQQTDLSSLLGLSGLMNGNTQYNNGLIGNSQNTLFGMIPNSNPSPIDVTGAYGINQAGQNAQYQGQQASANAQNQEYGEMASMAMMAAMMMCDRNAKDEQGVVDPEDTLQAVNTLPLRKWNYKGEETPHVGTYAQEFNAALGLPEAKVINVIDMLGALIGSVQALTKRIETIELARAA